MCAEGVCVRVCVLGAPLSLNELVSSSGGISELNSQTVAADCNKPESCTASFLPTGSGAEIVQDTDNSEGKEGLGSDRA